MPSPEPSATPAGFEPRRPALLAWLVFTVLMLALCWPAFTGKFLGGPHSDQYVAGYAFRLFGAEQFLATGSIPQWNPYMFGGLPFVAASHGDIFYPTAWLRWFLPVGMAMSLGFAIHLVLAGGFAYALMRALRCGWIGAVVGGVAYQLSGILASMVLPGHDGKLFVSALAPLLLLALLRGIRDGRLWGFGLAALTVGLSLLTPHPQMTYYLLVAAGIWTLYLVFGERDRTTALSRPVALGLAAGAVVLGAGIAAIFLFPFFGYFPYSPRAVGDSASSWEYATSYALNLEEIFGTFLPQFNGMVESYWGTNFVKTHSEYLGATVLVFAAFGIAARRRQRALLALAGVALLFLLVALGGDTPFYRLWYELMPMMKKVRAPGMAFFLVALPVCAFAAFGADRLVRREVSARAVMIGFGVFAALGLLALVGGLQPFAEGLADPRMLDRAVANAGALRGGGLRLLVVALAGGAVAWGIVTGRLIRGAAAIALIVVVAADMISVDRRFFEWGDTAQLFADDPVTTYLAAQPRPFRILDLPGQGVYPGSWLMTHGIANVFGYHGNEIRFYDEVWGGKNAWQYLNSANLWNLWAIRYLTLPQEQAIPGFHKVLGPVQSTPGAPAYLYERDTLPVYARVVPGALKVRDDQLIPTVLDPNLPLDRVLIYAESTSVAPVPLRAVPAASPVVARVAEWAPGSMRIVLDGRDTRATYLLVAENWYPDWHATVDGKEARVHRANHAMISVELPPNAAEVSLRFASSAQATGKLVSILALLATLAAIAVPLWRERRTARDPGMAARA